MLLRIDGVDAGYGRTQVLRGLTLDVAEGEHLGLFGPNGHGKTTLLRTISGLIAPTVGSIRLRDRRISGLDARHVVELGIIHVPQGNTMFPGLTVRENLEMGAYVKRARAGREARLRRVLELFPVLGDRQGQRSRTLSGGERQMLAIGVGLMGDPSILMLDEPTLGLAPRIKEILLAAIGEIERSGVTLILVDQDVEFLLGLSDRLCLIERGRVAYQATSSSALDDRSILSMYFGERGGSLMTEENVAAIVVSGVVLGSLYALISTGIALVWGTLNVFNFVFGTQIALAAYICWSVSEKGGLGAGLLWGFIASVALSALVGVVVERLLVRPFLKRPNADLLAMVTTIAGAAILQNSIQIAWGPRIKQLPRVGRGDIEIVGTAIGVHEAVIIVLAPLVLLLLATFLRRTRYGTAIRAVAQNPDAARLTGMDVGTVYSVTFALSSALAALAGVLIGAIFFITPVMGNDPLLKAFIVVVFGGLGSLAGTATAAYLVGLIESASAFIFGLYVTPMILFGVMIAVMWLRPQGLFGRRA